MQNKTLHLRYIGTDSWSRYVYEDENGTLWKLLDCCSPREVCEQRGGYPAFRLQQRFRRRTGLAHAGRHQTSISVRRI